MDTVRQIEEIRGLPVESLRFKLCIIDGDSDVDSPYYLALVQKEQERIVSGVLTRQSPPVNPFASALSTVGL